MLIKVFVVTLLFTLVSASRPFLYSGLVYAQARQKTQRKVVRYECPMHPEVRSTKRGRCPKCGMTLRLVKDKVSTPATPASEFPGLVVDTSDLSSLRIPDARVLDQDGNRINFYRDLVKGKTVAINFVFTTCTAICPPLTATFRRVQQEMATNAVEAQLISVSVDPTTDTPARLRDFAAKFKAGPGWTFVTGEKSEIDLLLQALGVAVANKNDHTPMILIGNDLYGNWTRAYGLSSPTSLIKIISEAGRRK